MHVRLSPRAQADIESIHTYLVSESPQGLMRLLGAIDSAFGLLEFMPLIGRKGVVGGTREWVVPRTNYIIVYTLNEPLYIDVECVLHGKQKYPDDDE